MANPGTFTIDEFEDAAPRVPRTMSLDEFGGPPPANDGPRFPGGRDLPGVGDYEISIPGDSSPVTHPRFDPPVMTEWPHTPYDPGGIDYPRDTGILAGIRDRAVDLFKGGVTTADFLGRGVTKMEADIAAMRGRTTGPVPTHGFGLAPGSPLGAFIKSPQTATIPDPQPTYFLTELENVKREIAYKPKITWAEVKQSSDPLDWGRFILQEGLISTPDMAAVLVSTPAYIFARTGSLAEDRAKNQGRNIVTGDDIMWALPTAIVAGAMERTGTRGIFFGTGQTAGSRIAKAGTKEAATEAGQEATEYAGTTLDTKKKFDAAEMLDRMAAGAVVGGPSGASLRTGMEGASSAIDAVTPPPPTTATPDELRAATDALSPYGPNAMGVRTRESVVGRLPDGTEIVARSPSNPRDVESFPTPQRALRVSPNEFESLDPPPQREAMLPGAEIIRNPEARVTITDTRDVATPANRLPLRSEIDRSKPPPEGWPSWDLYEEMLNIPVTWNNIPLRRVERPEPEARVLGQSPTAAVPPSNVNYPHGMGVVPRAEPSAALEFQTEKGSTYRVESDGTTVRNKAARPEQPGDAGVKPRSERTLYLSPQDAAAINPNGLEGQSRVAIMNDGTIALATYNEKAKAWGIAPSGRVQYELEPREGRVPVELWKAENGPAGARMYSSVHVGNRITSIGPRGTPTGAPVRTDTGHPIPSAAPVVAPPRIAVKGPDFAVEQINRARDLADRMGVTADIERLFAEQKTAKEVGSALGERLAAVDRTTLANDPTARPNDLARERANFARDVRNTLGIPSMDDHAEHAAWLAAYRARASGTTRTGAPLRTDTGRTIPPEQASTNVGRSSVGKLVPERTAAFTPAGRKIEVQHEVVELDSLIPSHTDDLRQNPKFPQELQPRERERAASAAQISEIAAKLEPERLGPSSDVTGGAAVVGPDNTVESGNARTLALRKVFKDYSRALKAGEDTKDHLGKRYLDFLVAQGFSIEGMKHPVLIARRRTPLSPADRVAFTKEANEASALRMGAAEQAKSDAGIVKPIIEQFKGGDVSFAQNAGFVRSFLNALSPTERGSLWTDKGGLSQEGVRRIQAAMLFAAYEDTDLVAKLMESPSNDIKSIGGALLDVSAAWAKLRALVEAGEISPDVERTKDLMGAVAVVTEARNKSMLVSDVLDQDSLFDDKETKRDFVGLFFNDAAFKQPASRAAVANRLRAYIVEANKALAGANFGDKPASAKQILKATKGVSETSALFEPEIKPRAMPENNQVTNLSRYAPTMYRETSLNALEKFLPNGEHTEAVYDGYYMADTPNLALGQGQNKGVTLAFDASKLRGYIDKSKPGSDIAFRNGEGEYKTVELDQAGYKSALVGFRISKTAQTDKIARMRLPRYLGGLENQGWTKRETAEFTEYTQPAPRSGSVTLRSGFDPTKPFEWYSRQAGRALDLIQGKVGYRLAPLGNLPMEPEYLAERYRTVGRLANIDKIGHKIFRAFRRADKADRKAVYDYMTTRGATPVGIKNPKVRSDAIEAKALIEEVGRKLVDHGLLNPDVFEAHRGEYLPRVYLTHLLGKKMSGARVGLNLGYLKERMDIPEDIRKFILGEITDPAYLTARGYMVPMRDLVFADFLDFISQSNEWTLKNSLVEWRGETLSAAWLWHEAQRLRTLAEHSESDRGEIIKVAVEMEAVAKPGLAIEKVEGFTQVPNTPKFGKLRGMWIRTEIWNDLFSNMGFWIEEPSLAEKILGPNGLLSRLTQYWKLGKVALNPGTIVRNTFGNVMLLQMSGVPVIRIPDRIIQSLIEIATDGRHWKIAKQYGVTSTNFAHAEMMRLDRLARSVQAMSGDPNGKLIALIGGIGDAAGRFYGQIEALFKVAKIIDAMEREGMSPEKAALESHKWIFDYSLVTKSTRYLRSLGIVGIPFLTFTTKVFPRLVEVAATKPWRVWPYVAMAYALPAIALSMLGWDEDDYEAAKKTLPKHMREKQHGFFLPWKDENGRVQWVDMSAWAVWNVFSETGEKLAKGDLGGAAYTFGLGGPTGNLLVAAMGKTDPFTGRRISNPYDTPEKQFLDWWSYIGRVMMPPWLTDQGAAAKMQESLTEKVDRRTGEPKLTTTQAGARFLGLNIYPIDPKRGRETNIALMRRELREMQSRFRYVMADKNLKDEDKLRLRDQWNARIREKALELQKYSTETERVTRIK